MPNKKKKAKLNNNNSGGSSSSSSGGNSNNVEATKCCNNVVEEGKGKGKGNDMMMMKGKKTDNICPICQDPIKKLAHPDVCAHMFCYKCILAWVKKETRANCPICRRIFEFIIHGIQKSGKHEIYTVPPEIVQSERFFKILLDREDGYYEENSEIWQSLHQSDIRRIHPLFAAIMQIMPDPQSDTSTASTSTASTSTATTSSANSALEDTPANSAIENTPANYAPEDTTDVLEDSAE